MLLPDKWGSILVVSSAKNNYTGKSGENGRNVWVFFHRLLRFFARRYERKIAKVQQKNANRWGKDKGREERNAMEEWVRDER